MDLTKRVSVAAVKNENAEAAMLALAKSAAPWPKLEVAEPKGFDTTFEQQTSGAHCSTISRRWAQPAI